MKHNLDIGFVDQGTKWHFFKSLASLELTDEANAVGWLISPWNFSPSRLNQGFMRYQSSGSRGNGLPDLVLFHGSTDVCVLVGFPLDEARTGDNSGIFGIRLQGECKLIGSNKSYVWAWINSIK